MTSEQPEVSPNGHYSVSATAKALGIDRKTLYRHTALRHIRQRRHRYTNRPFYLGSDIVRFWGAQY